MINVEFLRDIYDKLLMHGYGNNDETMVKLKDLMTELRDDKSTLKEKYWRTGNILVYRRDLRRTKAMNHEKMFIIIGDTAIALNGSMQKDNVDDNLLNKHPVLEEYGNSMWDVMEVYEPGKEGHYGSFGGVMNSAKLIWRRDGIVRDETGKISMSLSDIEKTLNLPEGSLVIKSEEA